jgi:lysyl-tRNA synthetase class 2
MARDIRQIAKEREIVNSTIRSFFRSRGYVEVETPILVRSPGMEPNLSPFETTVIEPDGKRHAAGLITSPEYSMKKLLGLGMEKIFTLTKVFRNDEELGGTHNPEFTMLEWYQQGADYHACMDETEGLVKAVCDAFGKSLSSFHRIRIVDLFTEAGLDLDHLPHVGDDTDSDAFHRAFLNKIEPVIASGAKQSPVFVYDYPIHQASLSRLTTDGKYGERFELYVDGLELCNGFTELTDADEQRRRFQIEAEERRAFGKTVFPVDEELLRLLPSVRQPTFGNALGVDRLHMIATGAKSIEDVLLFPVRKLFSV